MTMTIQRSQTHTAVYLQSPNSYALSLRMVTAPQPPGPQVTHTFPRKGGSRELMLNTASCLFPQTLL